MIEAVAVILSFTHTHTLIITTVDLSLCAQRRLVSNCEVRWESRVLAVVVVMRGRRPMLMSNPGWSVDLLACSLVHAVVYVFGKVQFLVFVVVLLDCVFKVTQERKTVFVCTSTDTFSSRTKKKKLEL